MVTIKSVCVGRVLSKYKVGKHFKLEGDSFSFEIDDTKVTAEG